MNKAEALKRLMLDNAGIVNWKIIYSEIEKYYPDIKKPSDWQAALRGIVYREIKNNNIQKIDTGIFMINSDYKKLNNTNNTNNIKGDINNNIVTEKIYEVKMRFGQDKFKKDLLRTMKKCPITGINCEALLIASHIKPWCFSNDTERLDIYNGFIFAPNIDKLFDRGFITFDTNKKIIFSNKISKYNLSCLNIENKIYPNLPIENREKYMEFHRNKIFMNY
jgi:hypothetical protein